MAIRIDCNRHALDKPDVLLYMSERSNLRSILGDEIVLLQSKLGKGTNYLRIERKKQRDGGDLSDLLHPRHFEEWSNSRLHGYLSFWGEILETLST